MHPLFGLLFLLLLLGAVALASWAYHAPRLTPFWRSTLIWCAVIFGFLMLGFPAAVRYGFGPWVFLIGAIVITAVANRNIGKAFARLKVLAESADR